MLNIKKGLCAAVVLLMAPWVAQADMRSIDDAELSSITGQALFNAERIPGVSGSNLTFYRLMLDTRLDLNMNIDRLKLGCGGVNDALSGPGMCDIDLENVSLMGRSGNSAGAVGSDFTLMRPYLEFAIKNDGNKASREVVGINIGAQSADGYMSIGRYDPSCGNANNISCHTGINSISGYLNTEISVTAAGSGTVLGFIPITFVGCFGNTQRTDDNCPSTGNTFTTAFRGTRMTNIGLANKSLNMAVYGGTLNITGVADLLESLQYLHGVTLANAPDFGISFQREQVQWPKFNPTSFNVMANTGFWFNLPAVKVLDAYANVGNVGDATSALGSGVALQNIDLAQRPADNCYGSTKFC